MQSSSQAKGTQFTTFPYALANIVDSEPLARENECKIGPKCNFKPLDTAKKSMHNVVTSETCNLQNKNLNVDN